VFSKYPKFLRNHHATHFVCDTLRMAISGGIGAFELDQMMELDMEVHHHEVSQPVSALSTVADALPVWGSSRRFSSGDHDGSLGGPPEEIGHKVAAALVGTFLGILMCYGFLGPLAAYMGKLNDAEGEYFRCLRVGLISFIKGSAPILSVEFARRTIPSQVRRRSRNWRRRVKAAAPEARRRPCRTPTTTALARSSSSRRRAAMAATTAARGKWPMPTSSPQ